MKEEIRKEYKKKRFSLSQEEVEKFSKEINQNYIDNLLPQIYTNKDQIISVYLSSYNEVSCDHLIKYFLENNIKFCYPKIIAKDKPLEFILAKENQKFIPNKIFPKILEPDSDEKIIPNILILPLLSFDKNLNRLGMGGGFFDRTIKHLKSQGNNFFISALSYDFQAFGGILPNDKNDQSLQAVVTNMSITF